MSDKSIPLAHMRRKGLAENLLFDRSLRRQTWAMFATAYV